MTTVATAMTAASSDYTAHIRARQHVPMRRIAATVVWFERMAGLAGKQ
jgi:hypothetical protein